MTSLLSTGGDGTLGLERLQLLSDALLALSFFAVAGALIFIYRNREGHSPGVTVLVVSAALRLPVVPVLLGVRPRPARTSVPALRAPSRTAES